MIGKKQVQPSPVGRKLYFKETRGNKPANYYIGKVIGCRSVHLVSSPVFGFIGDHREWDDVSLLIETSDHRRVQAYLLDTFEVNPNA